MRVRNRHGKIADAHQASHWRSTRRRGLVSVWAMRDESLGFLRDLINTPSPPGHEGRGQVKGVVGNVAPHLTKAQKDRKAPEIHDLFIDIGVDSRREAEKLVRIGDPITLTDEFDMLRGDLAVARAFDNRIGTFAVAE